MRGILIDPASQSVSQVEGDFRTGEGIRREISADVFTVLRLPEGHLLYLDDEGLLRSEPGPFFRLDALFPGETFAGRGLILASGDDGETLPAKVDVMTVFSLVSWPEVQFLRLEYSSREEDHPIFGKMLVHRQRAVFGPLLREGREESDGKGN